MTHTITTRDLLFEVIMQIKCRMRKDIGVIGVDLNPMQMKTLLCLQASGETPQTRLCRSMRRNKGQVARLTADLEQRKYLEKTTDENDKRRTLLRLTSKGGNAVRRFRRPKRPCCAGCCAIFPWRKSRRSTPCWNA